VLRVSLRSAVAGTVAGLPRQFWWLWTGTLVNRAGAFVLPFLAIYLTDSLGYSTAFAGLVLGAVGLGAAVANSILAFNIIKWIGVAYLVYLAVRQWRTATVDLREQIGKAMDGGRMSLVVRGFLVNATNPKGLVFFLAVLPQFVVPTAPLLPQYVAIGATMVAVDLVVMGLYTGLSVRLLRWLHTPRKQTIMNRVFSGLFATAAVVLSLVRRGPAAA